VELSGLESADMIDAIKLIVFSISDCLGPFGLFSPVRWSCIGRDRQTTTFRFITPYLSS
jgi:hypothetical protein